MAKSDKTTPRFQVQNLSLERNGRPVLREVNMEVAAGEIVWTVTIDDGDPDVDLETATTLVR